MGLHRGVAWGCARVQRGTVLGCSMGLHRSINPPLPHHRLLATLSRRHLTRRMLAPSCLVVCVWGGGGGGVGLTFGFWPGTPESAGRLWGVARHYALAAGNGAAHRQCTTALHAGGAVWDCHVVRQRGTAPHTGRVGTLGGLEVWECSAHWQGGTALFSGGVGPHCTVLHRAPAVCWSVCTLSAAARNRLCIWLMCSSPCEVAPPANDPPVGQSCVGVRGTVDAVWWVQGTPHARLLASPFDYHLEGVGSRPS